jgi:hypothetical protein
MGLLLGDRVGKWLSVGIAVGCLEGEIDPLGSAEGLVVGDLLGFAVGLLVGLVVWFAVGDFVGLVVGLADMGLFVGGLVGNVVGGLRSP